MNRTWIIISSVLLLSLAAVGMAWLTFARQDRTHEWPSNLAAVEQAVIDTEPLDSIPRIGSAVQMPVSEAPPDFRPARPAIDTGSAEFVAPEGYTLIAQRTDVKGASAADPFARAKAERGDHAYADMFNSPEVIALLVEQARREGRGYTFGYLQLAQNVNLIEISGKLAALQVQTLGASGKFIRAQLPGSPSLLRSVLNLPQVRGLAAIPAERKLPEGFSQESGSAGSLQRVFVTLIRTTRTACGWRNSRLWAPQ